jgi:hypothetical protein
MWAWAWGFKTLALSCALFSALLCTVTVARIVLECLPRFLVTTRKNSAEIMQYIESKVWGALINNTTLQIK